MKPINVPNIRDCSDILADLEARQVQIAKLIEQKFAEQLAIGAEPDDQPPVDPAEARVAALLGKPPVAMPGSKRERLAKLTGELSDLRRANERIAGEMHVARSKAMRIQREAARPEFLRRMGAFAKALAGVHAANQALTELEDALYAAGCTSAHEELRVPDVIGAPTNRNGPIAAFFAEAAKAGAISERDIPVELR